jgi:ATP-dependent RNA helicase DDX47/RRP3
MESKPQKKGNRETPPSSGMSKQSGSSSREEGREKDRKSSVESGGGEMAASSSSSASGAGALASGPSAAPTFKSLGICEPLCEAAAALKWKAPTKIQAETIPHALAGKDMIGLAETGSGKTGAFAMPILQALLAAPARIFALVLAPTRELAFQIAEQFEALGSSIGLKTAVVVGGVDMMTQAIALAKKPHIIIGTPGRVVDHLENTKGFSLRTIKYLVLDEADRMLSLDFEESINTILSALPRDRNTFLFSATMTSKVAKLQRASLRDPVRIEVSDKYQTVSSLIQQYLFIPARYKESYLVYVLNEFAGQSGIIFQSTCAAAQRTTMMLTNLGFSATCLHGQMSQSKRLGALNKFKAGSKQILVATDVASRGLDIPTVDLVINYDCPGNGKDYIHRVGRTARAGRAGRAITFVTQYDIELYQRIEHLLGFKLEAFPAVEEAALLLHPRVSEALRLASIELREAAAEADDDGAAGAGSGVGSKRKHSEISGGGGGDDDDDEGDETSAAAAAVVASTMRRKAMGAGIKAAAKGKVFGGGGKGGGGGKFRR